MKRFLFSILVLPFVWVTPAFGQEASSVGTFASIPKNLTFMQEVPKLKSINFSMDASQLKQDVKTSAMSSSTTQKKKVLDKKFWVLMAIHHSAMLFDGKTTFDIQKVCSRCVETDPYAKPFIDRGPVVSYIAGTAIQTTVGFLETKMRNHWNPAIRKVWWLPSVAFTLFHLEGARINLQSMHHLK